MRSQHVRYPFADSAPRRAATRRPAFHRRLIPALLAMTAASACSADALVAPELDEPAEAAAAGASAVHDLRVSEAAESSVTVSWTEVADSTGHPASYRLKYAPAPFDWDDARVACDPTIEGVAVGARRTCTVEALDSGAVYEFQVASFMLSDGRWDGVAYSNVAAAEIGAEEPVPAPDREAIWIDRAALMELPTSGPAWEVIVADAALDPGPARIADQDSDHDVYTLAAALVCARTGQYCEKARRGVLDAIGSERGARWLAVGRNLGAYVIAADVLDLREGGAGGEDGARVEKWMRGWLTKRLRDNNHSWLRGFGPFHSAANAAAQEGFAFAAVAAYLGDEAALERAWDAFRTFVCDAGAPDLEQIELRRPVRDGWTHSADRPCAVNPAGTTKVVPAGVPGAGERHRIDGALVGDMRRGGTYRWRPGYTQYVWVGLEGLVPAAVVLARMGYPAFEAGGRAVQRAVDYLWHLRSETGDRRWFDGSRSRDIVHLVNAFYGSSHPVVGVVGRGRTVGYTSWTHPR